LPLQRRRQDRTRELSEQNSAYEQSLEADRQKEAARLEEEAALKAAEAAAAEREQATENRIERLRAAVPAEPTGGEVGGSLVPRLRSRDLMALACYQP